jgi:hypothetical protein
MGKSANCSMPLIPDHGKVSDYIARPFKFWAAGSLGRVYRPAFIDLALPQLSLLTPATSELHGNR